jgi:FHS family L-fucose permease-like MFS transporter
MFPTIFSLAIRGLGRYTPKASGMLCVSIVGGALVPLTQGIVADYIGLHPSYLVPLLCYLFVMWYSWKGYDRSVGLVKVKG